MAVFKPLSRARAAGSTLSRSRRCASRATEGKVSARLRLRCDRRSADELDLSFASYAASGALSTGSRLALNGVLSGVLRTLPASTSALPGPQMLKLNLQTSRTLIVRVVDTRLALRVAVISLVVLPSSDASLDLPELCLTHHLTIPPVLTHERASSPVCAARRALWGRYDEAH